MPGDTELKTLRVDTAFLKTVGAILALAAALAVYPMLKFGTREIMLASVTGAVMSTVNVLVGFLAIEYSFERSYTTFLKAVLGGMGLRIGLMLAMLFVLIKFLGFHTIALTVSLLGFYLVFLILEIVFIQKKVELKSHT